VRAEKGLREDVVRAGGPRVCGADHDADGWALEPACCVLVEFLRLGSSWDSWTYILTKIEGGSWLIRGIVEAVIVVGREKLQGTRVKILVEVCGPGLDTS
jgi:hypothetical protein